MDRKPPAYIEAASVRNSATDFPHTQYAVAEVRDKPAPKITQAAARMTDRAKLAFATGLAEWIVWTVDGIKQIDDDLLFLESMWAAAIDYRYAVIVAPVANYDSSAEAATSAMRAICTAMLRVGSKQNRVKPHSCTEMAQIARQILIKSKHRLLSSWTQSCADQLVTLYPLANFDERDIAVRLGPPVLRQALDIDAGFKPKASNDLLREFLNTLDHKRNPYLQSPEKMKELGFEGRPYTI